MESKPRLKNMEMARIFAMSLIVLWHFGCHGGVFDRYPLTGLFASLLSLGVPVFVILSGYFTIKVKAKSFIRLSTIIAVFCLINYLAVELIGSDSESPYRAFVRLVMVIIAPMGKSPYWFIYCYCGLYFVSPLINGGLERMSQRQLRKTIFFLTFVNVVYCWLFRSDLNVDGYNFYNFVYLYVVGAWVYRESISTGIKLKNLWIILGCSILINTFLAGLGMAQRRGLFPPTGDISLYYGFAAAYNNPFSILSAACIILIFSKLKMKSGGVKIATASFGVYLLQEGRLGQEVYKWTYEIVHSSEVWVLVLIGEFMALWVLSYLITTYIATPLSKLVTRAYFNQRPMILASIKRLGNIIKMNLYV